MLMPILLCCSSAKVSIFSWYLGTISVLFGYVCVYTHIYIHNNNTGLNFSGPLICGFFLINMSRSTTQSVIG